MRRDVEVVDVGQRADAIPRLDRPSQTVSGVTGVEAAAPAVGIPAGNVGRRTRESSRIVTAPGQGSTRTRRSRSVKVVGTGRVAIQVGFRDAPVVTVDDDPAAFVGSGTAPRMPDCGSLQEHFFSIAERIPAFGASGARRMEVVVIAGLQHFSRNEPAAVGAFNPEECLVILFAVGISVLAHIFTVKQDAARLAFETPNVVLLI